MSKLVAFSLRALLRLPSPELTSRSEDSPGARQDLHLNSPHSGIQVRTWCPVKRFTVDSSQTPPLVTHYVRFSGISRGRDKPRSRHQKNHTARPASLAMASVNGVLSPPAHSESAPSSITSSAKRKRDDAIEVQNGTPDSKNLPPSGMSREDSQALIRDLIDVLKGYVCSFWFNPRREVNLTIVTFYALTQIPSFASFARC